MFLLGGCLTLWLLFLQPLLQLLEARSWVPTKCTILHSSIERKTDSDGTTYQPRIDYEYLVNGQRHTSSRYSFFRMTSGRSWAENIVAKYKTGTTHPCFYDPDNPNEAVLLREFSGLGFWFAALFPWLFIGVGGMMLVFGSRPQKPKQPQPPHVEESWPEKRLLNENLEEQTSTKIRVEPSTLGGTRRSISDNQTKRATPSPYSQRADWQNFVGPQKLLPAYSRLGAVVGLGLFALIWNAVTGLFFYEPLKKLAWLSLFFMAPFLIFGIILFGTAIYSFLKLFNPTVELAISEGAVPLGDSFDIAWELKGRVSRIKELVISAVCEEQATYARGTDTKTEKRVFQTIEIIRTSAVSEMQFGTANVKIPLDTMHSHSGDKNKITWKLTVQGDIPFFPNVLEEFEFRVIPRGVA